MKGHLIGQLYKIISFGMFKI